MRIVARYVGIKIDAILRYVTRGEATPSPVANLAMVARDHNFEVQGRRGLWMEKGIANE